MQRNIDCGYVVGKFPEDTYDNYINNTYSAVKKVMYSNHLTIIPGRYAVRWQRR